MFCVLTFTLPRELSQTTVMLEVTFFSFFSQTTVMLEVTREDVMKVLGGSDDELRDAMVRISRINALKAAERERERQRHG